MISYPLRLCTDPFLADGIRNSLSAKNRVKNVRSSCSFPPLLAKSGVEWKGRDGSSQVRAANRSGVTHTSSSER